MNYKIERFNESGQLQESSSSVGDDLLKDAILFETGTHRGKAYTVEHLQVLARSFNTEDGIPVQLDHSESAKDTVGFLESVYVKGNQLLGKLRVIEELAKEKVSKGLMKKVSISFYTDKAGNPNRIREVSLVAFPQLKGAQLFSEKASQLNEWSPEEVYKAFKLVLDAVSREEQALEKELQQYKESLGLTRRRTI
ncbi:hypothetical protein [Bacillus mycoides]|uniref:hypothetical protein n=1 Tax=Bacillus mycoides TaxID=1405 RepID=UPI002570352C|nr:hypothetical protein [Bacillus mycoides]MDM5426716.1 hypothetical protein [Bacillus mycoides]MED1012602.1 hypothetical protein [Bacillus mycoides]MED1052646.1 hypothetical protein [Bacillus mycoides]WJE65594.1 hypothetical protein QRE63_06725 [Bacillus mycoides]